MVNRRTNKGQIIDLDSIMAQQKDIPAMGNMGVDAEGNTLGPGGEIVEGRDQRVRAYYKDNPQSSTAQQSLKGAPPKVEGSVDKSAPEVKTAKTAKENVRTQKVKPDPVVGASPPATLATTSKIPVVASTTTKVFAPWVTKSPRAG